MLFSLALFNAFLLCLSIQSAVSLEIPDNCLCNFRICCYYAHLIPLYLSRCFFVSVASSITFSFGFLQVALNSRNVSCSVLQSSLITTHFVGKLMKFGWDRSANACCVDAAFVAVPGGVSCLALYSLLLLLVPNDKCGTLEAFSWCWSVAQQSRVYQGLVSDGNTKTPGCSGMQWLQEALCCLTLLPPWVQMGETFQSVCVWFCFSFPEKKKRCRPRIFKGLCIYWGLHRNGASEGRIKWEMTWRIKDLLVSWGEFVSQYLSCVRWWYFIEACSICL